MSQNRNGRKKSCRQGRHYTLPEDLANMYNNIYMDPSTPTGLANRVQIIVRLYFGRRANEIWNL